MFQLAIHDFYLTIFSHTLSAHFWLLKAPQNSSPWLQSTHLQFLPNSWLTHIWSRLHFASHASSSTSTCLHRSLPSSPLITITSGPCLCCTFVTLPYMPKTSIFGGNFICHGMASWSFVEPQATMPISLSIYRGGKIVKMFMMPLVVKHNSPPWLLLIHIPDQFLHKELGLGM